MQRIQLTFRFIRFFFQATTQYGVHSPFVFEFAQKVLDDDRQFYAFSSLEILRDQLLADGQKIQVTDLGAGSQMKLGNSRSIKAIANSSLTTPLYCKMLFRIMQLYRPKSVLELGTSLGLSTLYLAQGAASAKIISLEGCPNIAKVAQKNFQTFKATNIDLRTGHFDHTLQKALADLGPLDFAFLDGNHRKAPSIDYFEQCLEHIHEQSILVFDDIHWSTEMEDAWEEIKAHPQVSLTIDLFFMGLVFFRSDFKVKQHFKLVPRTWKPWILGFFGK